MFIRRRNGYFSLSKSPHTIEYVDTLDISTTDTSLSNLYLSPQKNVGMTIVLMLLTNACSQRKQEASLTYGNDIILEQSE
jgi:hypothetical protein